uniref:ATP-dependent Clp protease proteolytic subunit n=1 Tax=Pilgerodendron uviferum TaxID=103979 RepID=A0A6J4AJX6_9CONI|nr:clp protease proteolytic subunit [Pilgerodendron uviferum]BBN66834.1 ATP-dependent Clp protease proteolytic subunit [Pilgerodendron uviferum]
MSLNLGNIPKVPYEEGVNQQRKSKSQEEEEDDSDSSKSFESKKDSSYWEDSKEPSYSDDEEEDDEESSYSEDEEEDDEESSYSEDEEEDDEESSYSEDEEEDDEESSYSEKKGEQQEPSYSPQASSEEKSSYSEIEEETNWVEIYYKLFFGRYIFLGRPLEKQPADQIMKSLIYLNQENKKKGFLFFISCRGGGMIQGIAVYDVMQYVTGDVSTIGYGLNASMGAFLLHGGTCSKRAVSENARVMIHQPRMSPYDRRHYSGIESGYDTDNMNRLRTYVLETYIRTTKQEPEIIEHLLERDIYLEPKEAKNVNLIDEITVEGFDDYTNASMFYNDNDENHHDEKSYFIPNDSDESFYTTFTKNSSVRNPPRKKT